MSITPNIIYEQFIFNIADKLIEKTGDDSFDHLYVYSKTEQIDSINKYIIYGWALKNQQKFKFHVKWKSKPSINEVLIFFKEKFLNHERISIN